MPTLNSNQDSYSVATSPAKLIKRALRILGVIDPGEDLEAGELKDGLEGLNHMLDSWNTEKLVVPSLRSDSVSTSTRSLYVGPGGGLDIPRPSKLEEGQVFLRSGEVTYRLNKLTSEEYEAVAGYTTTGLPGAFYYDSANPTGLLSFDVIPDQAYTLIVYSWKLLTQTALGDINGAILLEPGYARAICFNLALDLADEWGTTASQNIIDTAVVSKANLKALYIEPIDPVGDSALTPITTGWVDKQAFNGGGV